MAARNLCERGYDARLLVFSAQHNCTEMIVPAKLHLKFFKEETEVGVVT